MPISKNNVERAKRIMRAKIRNGLTFAALKGSELYQDAVAAKTHSTFPAGPFDPPHSSRGEFPDRETGQGHESIDYAIAEDGRKSAFGVKGKAGVGPRGKHKIPGGMHLIWLTGKGRLGPVQILTEHTEEFASEFKAGAEATR